MSERRCELCGKPIPADRVVELNGVPLHVETCFAAMLPRIVLSEKAFAIALAEGMPPMVAYTAGRAHSAALIKKQGGG